MDNTEAFNQLRSFAIANNQHEFAHLCWMAIEYIAGNEDAFWAFERVRAARNSIEHGVRAGRTLEEHQLLIIKHTDCNEPGGGLPKGFDLQPAADSVRAGDKP